MGKYDAASGFEIGSRPAEVGAPFRVEVDRSSCCIAVIFLGRESVDYRVGRPRAPFGEVWRGCTVLCGAMLGSEERRGELALVKLWLLILRVRVPLRVGHDDVP